MVKNYDNLEFAIDNGELLKKSKCFKYRVTLPEFVTNVAYFDEDLEQHFNNEGGNRAFKVPQDYTGKVIVLYDVTVAYTGSSYRANGKYYACRSEIELSGS